MAQVVCNLLFGPIRVIGVALEPSSPLVSSSCGSWELLSSQLSISGTGFSARLNLCNITNFDMDNGAAPNASTTPEFLTVNMLMEVDSDLSGFPMNVPIGGGTVNLTSLSLPGSGISASIPSMILVEPTAAPAVQTRIAPAA